MPLAPAQKPLVVVVTGLSGAGMSTALHALTDSGFYCIDNLPVEMLVSTIELILSGRITAEQGFAFGMDVRDKSFAQRFPSLMASLTDRVKLDVVFLSADEHVIVTRYSANRRRHPMLEAGDSLQEAVARERILLSPVEEAADVVFDTSSWSPHALTRALEDRFSKAIPARILHLTVTSFGFKYGQHKPLDTLFDLRFLDNPYFVPELKDKSGRDAEVENYVFSKISAQTMFTKIEDLLRFSLPLYYTEGKHYFRVGVGCSGGRHRSVAFAEKLGRVLNQQPIANVVITVVHRDIDQ